MITKGQVIKHIADNQIVEKIIKNVAGSSDEDLKDLAQDIYIELFSKDEKLLINLYLKNNLNFYLSRIITNNIFSRNSRFYYQYKKNNSKKVKIEDVDTTKF